MFTMFTKMFTIVYMATKPRAFRFSEEAEAILSKQQDPKLFIEQLITGTHVRPLEVVSLQQLRDLLDEYNQPLARPLGAPHVEAQIQEGGAQKNIVSPTAKRSLGDIRNDISLKQQERDEAISESQDFSYSKELERKYNAEIEALWQEFHATKGATNEQQD